MVLRWIQKHCFSCEIIPSQFHHHQNTNSGMHNDVRCAVFLLKCWCYVRVWNVAAYYVDLPFEGSPVIQTWTGSWCRGTTCLWVEIYTQLTLGSRGNLSTCAMLHCFWMSKPHVKHFLSYNFDFWGEYMYYFISDLSEYFLQGCVKENLTWVTLREISRGTQSLE